MTNNTNDTVGVLISALEKLAAQDSGIVASSAKSDCMAATAKAALRNYKAAAIQHSEQRETVPAGGMTAVNKLNVLMSDACRHAATTGIPNCIAFADIAMRLDGIIRDLAPPVAAPVPEAKAVHQSEVWCVESKTTKLLFDSENAARRFMSGLSPAVSGGMTISSVPVICNAPQPAAPAVKHEASELPPLQQDIYMVEQSMLECEPEDQRAWSRVKACLSAHPTAPPIAVQGSIGDDAAPTKAMLLEAIDDKVARSEDLMSDFPPHRAMERWNEASATLKDIVNRLFDSRSPVAAAPNTSARDAIAKAYGIMWHVNAGMDAPAEVTPLTVSPERGAYEARKVLRDLLTHEQRGAGINAAREVLAALSAAAPSADAKADK